MGYVTIEACVALGGCIPSVPSAGKDLFAGLCQCVRFSIDVNDLREV